MFIGRETELNWLKRSMAMDNRIVVSGLRGVGKSHLVRQFLSSQNLKVHWYNCSEFSELSQILFQKKLGKEEALNKAQSLWQKDSSVVVWGKSHLLPDAVKKYILGQLSSHFSNTKHIFLCDGEFLSQSQIDFPQLKLMPFSGPEVSNYINELAPELGDSEIQDVYEVTGGVPLLINLFIQNGSVNQLFNTISYSSLSESSKMIFEYLSLSGRIVEKSELENAFGPIENNILPLMKHYIVESVSGDSYQVPDFVRMLFINGLDKEERQKKEQWFLSFLKIWLNTDELYALKHALLAVDSEKVNELLNDFKYERLEVLHKTSLEELYQALKPNLIEVSTYTLGMRILSLLGEKRLAIELGQIIIEREQAQDKLNEKSQLFILEFVRANNRMQEFSRALDICQKVGGRLTGAFKTLFLIEQGQAYASAGDLARALKAFERVICESKPGVCEHIDKGRAFSFFEQARIYGRQNEYIKAIEFYNLAKNEFSKNAQVYYSIICQLNLSWTNLKLLNFREFRQNQKEFFKLAKAYGNNYMLGGAHLMEAYYNRYILEYGKSLHHIGECSKYLSGSAPVDARFDLLEAQFNTFLLMGLRGEAQMVLERLKELIKNSGLVRLEQRYNEFDIRFRRDHLVSEEFIPEWEKTWGDSEALHDQLFEVMMGGLIGPTVDQEKELTKYPLGQLRLAEINLIQAIAQKSDSVWAELAQFEKALGQSSEAMGEKVVLQLMYYHLQGANTKDNSYLNSAKIELRRWGADAEVKAPLEAWIDAIELGVQPQDTRAWHQGLAGQKERWAPLFNAMFSSSSEAKYLLITHQSRVEVSELNELNYDIVVREDLGEIYVHGQIANQFLRRHHLRKTLSCLLESAPLAVSKENLAGIVWGESYNPECHDARIYTSIQRIRKLIGDKKVIQTWGTSYRFNPQISFCIVRSLNHEKAKLKRTQMLILQALESFSRQGQDWVSRSQLKELADCSDATLKRELTDMLNKNRLQRRGRGRAVMYSI